MQKRYSFIELIECSPRSRYATPQAAPHAPVHSPFYLRVGDALSLNAAFAIDGGCSATPGQTSALKEGPVARAAGAPVSYSIQGLCWALAAPLVRAVRAFHPGAVSLAARDCFLLACALVGCLGKGPKDRLARTIVYPNRLGCGNKKPQPIRFEGVSVGDAAEQIHR